MVNVNYEIPEELHRSIRIIAAKRGTTIKALLIEALEHLVAADEEGDKK